MAEEDGGTTVGHPGARARNAGNRMRRQLVERVQGLGETEHAEILRILRSFDVAHSCNSNGAFVNLSTVPDDVVQEVAKRVNFCCENKARLDEYDRRLHECRMYASSAPPTLLGGAGPAPAPAPARAGSAAPSAPTAATPISSLPTSTPACVPETSKDPTPLSAAKAAADSKGSAARFQASKKRHARKRVADRKNEGGTDDLRPEPFPLG